MQQFHRLFLAIPVSVADYHALRDRVIIHKYNLSAGKFTPEENAHITVRFFGDIDENQIPLLYEKIKEKIQEMQIRPFKVIPEKIGMFPNQNGKLIAAYIQKNEMLINLFHLFHEIEVSNAHQDKKMFLPHITLFRAKNDYKMNIEDIKLNNFSLPINKFIIYESQLINHERRYIPLFSIPIIE